MKFGGNRDMQRGGGGICIAEPQGSLTNGVSPRIRALQDRLLDSLPADGAWECLSPAQREAIISLHRVRITKNLAEKSPEKHRKDKITTSTGGGGGLNRYGRSRSYEDKLESETDDSGVRLMSGETNSSSTSNSQNSHEDDSSDPGVKRVGGRFTKSPRVDRILRKETKTPYDPSKRKGVTNGVGNVNKIISKQLYRNAPHQQQSSNVTLDCRNIVVDNRRSRIHWDNFVDPRLTSDAYRRGEIDRQSQQPVKLDKISRKNILQRYQDSIPKSPTTKETTSSEECDSGVHFKIDSFEGIRRPSNGIGYDYSFGSDRYTRSDNISSTPSPRGYSMENSHMFHSKSTERLLEDDFSRGQFKSLDSSHLNRKHRTRELQSLTNDVNSQKINTSYDYRTELNQEGFNKYSNNWKSMTIKREVIYPKTLSDANRLMSNHHRAIDKSLERKQNFKQDKNQPKKYIRSKSLDRKYLDDSTDDESDFEVRRRTERMQRYAKANQEWDFMKQIPQEVHRNIINQEQSKPKAKSDWDLTANPETKHHRGSGGEVFRSRSKILNKWKSEDADLAIGVETENRRCTNLERSRWRRKSCDFELDMSDGESRQKTRMKQWQRRSCDFELDLENEEFLNRHSHYDEEWDKSVAKEINLLHQRKKIHSKQEEVPVQKYPIRKETTTKNYSGKKEAPPKRIYTKEDVSPPTEVVAVPRRKETRENFRSELKPEICGRKWIRAEDLAVPKYSSPYPHPNSKPEKSKTPHAFRGKLRLFKSLLSF